MGFIKSLGEMAGIGAGVYFGGIIELAGAIVGSDSIEKFGEKVFDASTEIGEKLGDIAENAAETSINAAKGAVSTYSSKQDMVSEHDNQKITKALDVFDE